jgi:hypothetical protein
MPAGLKPWKYEDEVKRSISKRELKREAAKKEFELL